MERSNYAFRRLDSYKKMRAKGIGFALFAHFIKFAHLKMLEE